MSKLDETNGTPDGGSGDGAEPADRDPLTRRVQELERENARLRAELAEVRAAAARDRDVLNALIRDDLPRTEAERREWEANDTSFSELLRGLEREFGLEPPK